ncbi:MULTISPECIES: ABC transporter substrate-binding protein [unclassified Haladaptatus]|uniref:ABC transporter substrate-binding protein n=1 Tax=unclassified Haladaptatus TaxID=2622732 RepID=UPI00209BD321|nr:MULTISPECIES: ABC transporter substrate-binding protein [unclassified Haladaptatus]MCO8243775.1 ABC transporter substrate-binding protein [Haladaptatus sp. AB643]MCO8256716.1 ABC transporter substrate-binding protein [Haladaptatus sp. AB618]
MTGKIIEYDIDRREFLGIAGALTGVSLAGCTGNGSTNGDTNGNGSGGGGGTGSNATVRLNVGMPAEPWNFDPALWSDTSSSIIGRLIYDEVIELSTNTKLQPGLAKSVPKSKSGGKAFEYTLRDGLTFHNGDEVTVEDFKYSVDWILNPDNNSPVRRRIPFASGTKIVDDRTLRLELSKPFTTINWWLTRGLEGIVPKGSRGSTSKGKGPSGFSTNLTRDPSGAGTGPFEFVEWKSGSHVLLKKNDDYWKDGLPKVDEIKFLFISEDATRLSKLRSGNLDLTSAIPAKDYKSMTNRPNLDGKTTAGNTTEVLYPNLMDTGNNPMANVHNRRAVLFGIDAQEILKEIFYGNGVVQKGLWYPDSEWTSPNLKKKKLYDPEKARAELKKAGNPDGFSLKLITTKGGHFKDEAVIIQNQLGNIGIDVEISVLEKSALFDQVYDTKDWQIALENWTNAVPVVTYWLRSGFADNNHNHVNWHHESPDLDDKYKPTGPAAPSDAKGNFSNGHEWFVKTLEKAQALDDQGKQKKIVWKLEEYLVENAIQIDIAYSNRYAVWNSDVTGFKMGKFTSDMRGASKK